MMKHGWMTSVVCLAMAGLAQAREAKVVRSPSYHEGKVAFSYLGDIWTAREDGSGIVRLTANKARDLNPRFSPDGKTIAFSSDREGGLDVYLIPSAGGDLKRLTLHSADDTVLGWSPDGKSVLFASQRGEDFMGKLYTVSIDGGASRNAGPDMGLAGSYSPDGTKLAINRKAQSYWRKYYRGAYQSDVTVMDLASKTFKDLTEFDGMDSWPMWATDGRIYFVSDRDPSSQANIWYVPESGGEAVKVTDFKDGDVRFPSISADGKTIVFERDFGISKLDLASRTVTPLHFDIAAETQESLTEFRDFNSTVDDYDVAPNGRRVAFAVHGRIFTAPTDENGELRQITDGPVRDQDLSYSPDGKLLAFVSDKTGREEIYVTNPDGVGEPRKITDIDALKSNYTWSPDSKLIAFTTSEGKLYTMTAEGADLKELASSKYGNISRPAWSPEGKWIAFSKPDVSRSSDVYLIPSAGGDAVKVTFDSLSEMNPQFSADSKKLYFVRMEAETGEGQGARPSSQIYCIPLEKLDKDPEEAEVAAMPEGMTPGEGAAEGRRAMGPGAGGGRVGPAKEPKIDWAGLKRRTRQVTRMGSVRNYIPGVDGKTLIFVGSEGGGGFGGGGGGGGGGSATIYTIQDDGKRLNSLVSATPVAVPAEGDATPPPGRRGGGFGGGGISSLALTRDGRTLYFQEGDAIYSTTVTLGAAGGAGGGPGGGGGGRGAGGGGGRGGMGAALAAATAAPAAGGGAKRKISFNVTLEINKPAEWGEMFDDAWRTMKYRFYDAKMHGKDWDAMRAKYKPLVSYVGDRHELMNLINEMIGELNASHTGASAAPASRAEGGSVTTRHLGIDLDSNDPSGLYKVGHVYEDGPLDKDWFKVEKGNYLVAIDGKPVKTSDDVAVFLGRRLNRKVELTLNTKPEETGSWKIKYEPITMVAFANLRYERWVKERRAKVDELSKGRVGYLHIKAMDQPSLARFKKDLAEFRHKEALVIDQRWNGGGNIEQELLAILVQRPYQIWQPRGTEPTPRPFNGYFGPKVVMQNWRSASNAEMFPAGFRALGLGKVVGTPTMGAVIGTGSYSLIDGSTIRTPGVGVYLSDDAHTNMENNGGIKPDVYVENSPEDNLAGRDRQLEVAVKEVMKDSSQTATLPAGNEVSQDLRRGSPATSTGRPDTTSGRPRSVLGSTIRRLVGALGSLLSSNRVIRPSRHRNSLATRTRSAAVSYSDFTLELAESLLGVRARGGELFRNLAPATVPDWLRDSLARGMQLALTTEKARSELIVSPILLAARELSGGALAIFSGQRLDVDPARGLVGECDFLLSLGEPLPRFRAPIVALVEAKKHDIDLGMGQCIAQMVAARDFNERDETGVKLIHGCVTTGETWQFLRLDGSSVIVDPVRLFIDNVEGILAMFQAIVAQGQESSRTRAERPAR